MNCQKMGLGEQKEKERKDIKTGDPPGRSNAGKKYEKLRDEKILNAGSNKW